MIKTVIFDIGGTLLGGPDLAGRMAALFPGADATDRLRSRLMGEYRAIAAGQMSFVTMETIVANTLRDVSAELGCQDMSAHAKEVYYGTFVTSSWLYDDTVSVLEWLKGRGIGMIVASDGDAELLYEEFRMYGIGGYFHSIFISSEVGAYKPNEIFVDALRQEVADPRAVLIVGDSECDIITGRKLGAVTVLKGSSANIGSRPDYCIGRLAELPGIIERLG